MEHSTSKTPWIIAGTILLLSAVVSFLLMDKCSKSPEETKTTPEQPSKNSEIADPVGDAEKTTEPFTGHTGTPEELVGKIREVMLESNKTGDASQLINLLGQKNLNNPQAERLQKLAQESRLKLHEKEPFSRLESPMNRWALNLRDSRRILLDLTRGIDGKWRVDGVVLPEDNKQITESIAKVDDPIDQKLPPAEQEAIRSLYNFINAITELDLATARKFIDTEKVSYSKIAGLCILFEEGKYTLKKDKPVKKMFLRDTAAGWMVRLQSPDAAKEAMFALSTKRKDADSPWLVTEISLDKLLADYATRFSDGDIHYTPLVKNPKGGDSLAIYFDLDSGELTQRTKQQLTIVANLLKADAAKKLTISGHTDALGSDEYNMDLSKKRADAVMHFLKQKEVAATQMTMVGFGKSKPRVPNTTQEGFDNPDGRRANRRAEILLDF